MDTAAVPPSDAVVVGESLPAAAVPLGSAVRAPLTHTLVLTHTLSTHSLVVSLDLSSPPPTTPFFLSRLLSVYKPLLSTCVDPSFSVSVPCDIFL